MLSTTSTLNIFFLLNQGSRIHTNSNKYAANHTESFNSKAQFSFDFCSEGCQSMRKFVQFLEFAFRTI